jgi:integral membrane protein
MTASSAPPPAPAGGRASEPAVRGSLLRYRVIAYIVGVVLIVLVGIGMPLKYIGDNDAIVAGIGPIHGILYMLYLAGTFDLANRCRFPVGRTVLIMLAGTIPFLSFFAERRVSALVRQSHPALAAPSPSQAPAT